MGYTIHSVDEDANIMLSDYESGNDDNDICPDSDDDDDAMTRMSADVQKLLYRPRDGPFKQRLVCISEI